MEKRWVIKEQGDLQIIKKLSQELSIDQYLSNLLAQRGITTFEEAKTFFRPSLDNLHDPFLMKDMAEAIHRIELAILNNE
jgi:single-stranded-DNA-specific exonuclease